MTLLFDTCAVSEMVRRNRNPGFENWMRDAKANRIAISTVTIAEVEFGIAKLTEGKRRDALATATQNLFERIAVLDLTRDVARQCGALLAERRRYGSPMKFTDAAIAATALTHNLSVVTRDADFEGTSARIVNPWND